MSSYNYLQMSFGYLFNFNYLSDSIFDTVFEVIVNRQASGKKIANFVKISLKKVIESRFPYLKLE